MNKEIYELKVPKGYTARLTTKEDLELAKFMQRSMEDLAKYAKTHCLECGRKY